MTALSLGFEGIPWRGRPVEENAPIAAHPDGDGVGDELHHVSGLK